MPSPGIPMPPQRSLIEKSQDTRAQSVLLCQWAREQCAASVRLYMLTRELAAASRGVWQWHEALAQRLWRYDGC